MNPKNCFLENVSSQPEGFRSEREAEHSKRFLKGRAHSLVREGIFYLERTAATKSSILILTLA